MFEMPKEVRLDFFQTPFEKIKIAHLDTVAISCYVWNEYLLLPFVTFLKQNGFKGKIVLGGYQISYSNENLLKEEYPYGDIFISSYGEKGLVTAIFTEKRSEKLFLNETISFGDIPSPYLTQEITVNQGQKMIRFETKRGCPYRCTFCAHRDLSNNKVHKQPLDKVFEEIAFLKEKAVKRINILDPIFNVGKDYNKILQEFLRVGVASEITLQTRFEQIVGDMGVEFLDLCEQLNVTFEFGLQTIIEKEYNVINRRNDRAKIERTLRQINHRKTNYEISLIYGIPNQTLDTFKESIDFARNMGCNDIKAYPLMLLKGTELFDEKEKWGMRERLLGDFNIPVVVKSNTFTEDEWWEMKEIADNLLPTGRI
jgi:radical SAM superfamily enzyme YgiQ (UPF0313 family)